MVKIYIIALVFENKINRFSLGVPPPSEPIARNSNFQAHVLPVIYGDIATSLYMYINRRKQRFQVYFLVGNRLFYFDLANPCAFIST